MSNLRAHRVGEQMKKELSEIIGRRMKDPRVSFVTVTGVDVSGDLQHAKVYVRVLGDEEKKQEALDGLQKAKGFIRQEIARRIRLRKTPEIHFVWDESLERGSRIEELLRRVKKEENDDGEEG